MEMMRTTMMKKRRMSTRQMPSTQPIPTLLPRTSRNNAKRRLPRNNGEKMPWPMRSASDYLA